jgi:S-formylglutathione hydrolase FrmB
MKKFLLLCLCTFLILQLQASKTDTLFVRSKSMGKTIPNLVIMPDSYTKNGNSFNVVYLLHGAGGNFKDWSNNIPQVHEYADMYNFIIVCPDGGVTSWYFDSPIDSSMRYETYISKELIEAVDTKYHTINNKNARAITGLSMGGHGAFYLSFRHQDIWGAAGSMSGGVDFRPFPDSWDIAKRLGKYSERPDNWEKNVVINMVDSVKGKSLKLIFDCGVSDFFCTGNRNLHQKLLENKVPHDYIERPGVHDWHYWGNSIQYQLLFFYKFFTSHS